MGFWSSVADIAGKAYNKYNDISAKAMDEYDKYYRRHARKSKTQLKEAYKYSHSSIERKAIKDIYDSID